jgi:hypothetical protein
MNQDLYMEPGAAKPNPAKISEIIDKLRHHLFKVISDKLSI